MVFKHTARYWRRKYAAYRVKHRADRNSSWKNFSRKPVLDRLLKTILSSSVSHVDGSRFLAFTYYYDQKLIFSISRNDGVTDVYEILEEKEIVLNLTSLAEKRIPQWILNNFDHLQYGLNSEFCLTNISFVDCENTASVFCYLSKSQVNNMEIPMETTENVSPNEDLDPLQQISSPDDDNPPSMENQVSNINDIQELEKYLRRFLKWCKENNGFFLLHHVEDEKMHSTVYTVFAENDQLSGYLFNDDGETSNIIQCLMNHDMSEFSHLKIHEFSMENLEPLNNYIIHLVQNTLENSAQLQLMYKYPSDGKVETAEVCIINWMKDKENEHVLDKEDSFSNSLRIDDISLEKRDLCTVCGERWLNDTIIDAYLKLIAMRSRMYPDALPSVHVFSTYFLRSSRPTCRRRNALRILESDLLFFPINPDVHWTLLCADNRRRTLLHYDSLWGRPLPLHLIERAESFLFELDPSLPRYEKGIARAARQTNGSDCGIFLLMHAECLSRNAPFTFTQQMMPDIRETVMRELLLKKISAPVPKILPVSHSVNQTPIEVEMVSKESLGSSRRNICKINDITVQKRDLYTLSEIRCLNDTVIDAYLNLIALRSKTHPEVFPSVYVFNSFFLKSILSGRCTKIKYHAVDILQSNLLFIPYNPGEHWTLFCVDNRKRTIMHYDPYLRKAGLEILCAIERFLLKLAALNPNCVPLEYQKGKGGSVVEWRNRHDCGVLLLLHVEYLSRNEPFSFTQESMPLFRHQITYEFLLQKLSASLPLLIPSGFKEIVVDIGEIGGPYSTLTFNFDLQPIIVSSYMNLLQKKFEICVYPDEGRDSHTLLIPVKSERGWGLVAVEKHKQLVTYLNIMPEIVKTNLLQNLDLDLSHFLHTELSFPNHSIDSGVFVLATSYCIAKNIPISPFNENHVSYLRTKIFLELTDNSMKFA